MMSNILNGIHACTCATESLLGRYYDLIFAPFEFLYTWKHFIMMVVIDWSLIYCVYVALTDTGFLMDETNENENK